MKCPHEYPIKTLTGHRRYIRCRKCLACRLTRQYDWANRLAWDIANIGPERCFFFGLTYRPEDLPMSPELSAMQTTPAQDKLRKKLGDQLRKDERRRNGPGLYIPFNNAKYDFIFKTLEAIRSPNPSKPTIRAKDMVLWKKRGRERLSFLPRILSVGEYGGKRGRPHNHAVVLDISEAAARVLSGCWDAGSVHYEPVQSDKLGGYISKDIVKSTWSKEAYIAVGREAPFMTWPNGKGRAIAGAQESLIYEALKKLQSQIPAAEFEAKVHRAHFGKYYRTRTPAKGDGPAVSDKGKTRATHIDTLFSKTAYKNAMARILRDVDAVEYEKRRAIMEAHFMVELTNSDSGFYDEVFTEKYSDSISKAERGIAQAKKNHDSILNRKAYDARLRRAS